MTDAMVLDPVCGMTIDRAEAVGQFEYRGKTYQLGSWQGQRSVGTSRAGIVTPAGQDADRAPSLKGAVDDDIHVADPGAIEG